jgi:hypothetical protein
MSGYTHCLCRDCFEVVVSADQQKPELCSQCEEYGCDGQSECLAPNAYGMSEEADDVAVS